MLDQSTTSAERDYWDVCALEDRRTRKAAEAVNEMMSHEEALFFLLTAETCPDAAGLIEDKFDAVGWPEDDLSVAWLNDTGRAVWAAYLAYREMK